MIPCVLMLALILVNVGYKLHHREANKPSFSSHTEAQSWDQANLKRNDNGCPTAIYVAPNGNLEQCE